VAIASSHIEKITLVFVKGDLYGVVFDTPCTADKSEGVEVVCNGFEFVKFHNGDYI
jgi:hypothetical protein